MTETLRLITDAHRDHFLAVPQARIYLSGGTREDTRFEAIEGWWELQIFGLDDVTTGMRGVMACTGYAGRHTSWLRDAETARLGV